MGKYEPNDKVYTIIGIFVVIIGVVAFIFTGLSDNQKLDDKNEEVNGGTVNQPVVDTNNGMDNTGNDVIDDSQTNLPENNDNVIPPTTDQTEDNGATVPPTTNNPENEQVSNNSKMKCTQNIEETDMKTEHVCNLEFKNNYLAYEECISVMTSSDDNLLKQQYSVNQVAVSIMNSAIKDKSVINFSVDYEPGKKVTLKYIADYIKLEQNPNAVTEDFESDRSSKNTKEEVKKMMLDEGYTCN